MFFEDLEVWALTGDSLGIAFSLLTYFVSMPSSPFLLVGVALVLIGVVSVLIGLVSWTALASNLAASYLAGVSVVFETFFSLRTKNSYSSDCR